MVTPFLEMLAQMWPLYSCSELPFLFGSSHLQRKDSLESWHTSRIGLNIRQCGFMMTLNVSWSAMHLRYFTQFASMMNWQYKVPVWTQPSFFLTLTTSLYSWRSLTRTVCRWRWGAVNSSLLSILASMKLMTSMQRHLFS